MEEQLHIQVILGSTRKNRAGERIGTWVRDRLAARDDCTVEYLDLRDYPLPYYEEDTPPAALAGEYPDNPSAQAWFDIINKADGYVIVTPEYNHGYPAVLKNALDYPYQAWNSKPVGFVSYSGSRLGGIRAVEQLRLVAIELQMAPIRQSVAIGNAREADLSDAAESLDKLAEQLLWWAQALKPARENAR